MGSQKANELWSEMKWNGGNGGNEMKWSEMKWNGGNEMKWNEMKWWKWNEMKWNGGKENFSVFKFTLLHYICVTEDSLYLLYFTLPVSRSGSRKQFNSH